MQRPRKAHADATEARVEAHKSESVKRPDGPWQSSVRNQQAAHKRAAEQVGQQNVAPPKKRVAELDAPGQVAESQSPGARRNRFRG